MTIEERIMRNAPEDQIYIGGTMEQFYISDAGTILRAFINGRIKEQVSALDDIKTSCDRRLGRAEGIQMLQDDIELSIQRKNQLLAPLPEGEEHGQS
jgi:hypothetical protein